MLAADQNTRAVRATNDDINALGCRFGHHALQGAGVIEQRIAAGQQHAVGAGFGQIERQLNGLHAVHTQTPALDDALVAQAAQSTECTRAGNLEMGKPFITIEVLCNIVNPDKVQAVGAQALQAVFDGLHRALFRVVVDDTVGATEFKETAFLTQITVGSFHLIEDHPADLGAEHIVVTIALGQRLAQANF